MSIRVLVADDQEIVGTGLRMILDAQPGIEVEATRILAGPHVADPLAVVVITTFDLDEYVYAALRAGARGFLLKDAGPDLLAQAVHAAAGGDALIAPSITARLLAAFADAGPTAPPLQPIETLTDREEQVLTTVARGRTNNEIADELYITLSIVKTHVASLMAKIGARNRVEIAMWAYETNRIKNRWKLARNASAESTTVPSDDRLTQIRPMHR
ncbi:response regulator transcription factor [Frankia sp. Cas4]|uniref:response regulator transcription factor n=1 Tax=Frankia sp. Cas4 TaxID=3073927 RepID=UPI002AD38F68|nr:response regulator transcription factor [Frankia sp. Cas4]